MKPRQMNDTSNGSFRKLLQNRRGLTFTAAGMLAVIVLLCGAFIGFQDNIFRWSINPRTPFQTYVPPQVPDYTDRSAWALFPEKETAGAWEEDWGVDVFFIHPTSYYSNSQWNAPIDDAEAHQRLLQEVLPNHVQPFTGAGEIYAPLYRQATLISGLNFAEDSRQALFLAYSDVLAAFDEYMAHHNRGRAVMLVGINQGGLHAQRLLADRFQNPRMQERLVAAYLIGSGVPMDLFDTQLKGLAACDTPDQIQCVVSWGVVYDGDESEADRFRNRSKSWTSDGQLLSTAGRRLVCVNPVLWNTQGDFAPSRLHRGGASATGLDMESSPPILPGAVSTQCVDGVLISDQPREPQLRPGISLGARFKTPDFNLFYSDIQSNAELRASTASAWLNEFGAKPAPPMPKATEVGLGPRIVEVQDPEVNPSAELRRLPETGEE